MYPEAAHAIKEMLEEATWDSAFTPTVVLLSFDYLQNADNTDTIPPESRESDWVTVCRMGGESINTMDGWAGISQQVIKVGLYSLDRTRVSAMERVVHAKINGFVGTHSNVEFQMCLLDEVFDLNEEESSINGKDMFFLTVVSHAG